MHKVRLLTAILVASGGGCLAASAAPSAPIPAAMISDVPVPGGTAAVARLMGVDPGPRAFFVSNLARRLYASPEGKDAAADRARDLLLDYLDGVGRVQDALNGVVGPDGTFSIGLSKNKPTRKRLQEFLGLVGLTLREHSHQYTVVANGKAPSAEWERLLGALGVDPTNLARALNAGGAVRLVLRSETVPVALDPAAWSDAVFEHPVTADGLFAAIVRERRAALLAYGLACLDEDTLAYLASHRTVLKRLFDHDATVFAAFGRSLHVRNGRVMVAGGDDELWQRLVGESVVQPDRFVRKLFESQDGRIAYMFDAVANLDPPHARFVLGSWMVDPGARHDRFAALADVVDQAYPEYQPAARPFLTPAADLLQLLARVAVGADGAPAPPNLKRFWAAAFDGSDLPDEPVQRLRDVTQDGVIDAAWLADHILTREPAERAERLDRLSFGQRVFRTSPDELLPDVLVAVRAMGRLRLLMLTLERIGIADPAQYAAAARRGAELTNLDHTKAFAALSQFQSSLALVARLRAVRTIDRERAAHLVQSLVSATLTDGRYMGAVGAWLRDDLLPALSKTAATIAGADERMQGALSGEGSATPSDLRTFTWEGRSYRLDLAGAERRRLDAVRKRQAAPDIEPILAVWQDVQDLVAAATGPTAGVAAVHSIQARLAKDGAALAFEKASPPPGADAAPEPRAVIARAMKDLARVKQAKHLERVAGIARPVLEACDRWLADALMSYVYALALGDPDGTVLLAGNVARGHDFGFTNKVDEERLRTPWEVGIPDFAPGTPWHVRGSVLGLDVALAPLALRRVASEQSAAEPVLNGNDRRTFVQSVALLQPFAMTDRDRDEIAAAIRRGRDRVDRIAAGAEDPAAALAAVPSLTADGFRQQAIRWAIAHDPADVAQWFSLSELLALGSPATGTNPDAWGTSALPVDACLCSQLWTNAPWGIFTGQTAAGLLASRVSDLHLRVAEVTSEWHVPAAVARDVLEAAVQEFVDTVRPLADDDWVSLVVAAQGVTKEQIADDMAALTTSGLLVPVRTDSGIQPR